MNKTEFLAMAGLYGDDVLKLMMDHPSFLDFLENEGFFTAPASTRFHGSYEGGLFDHSCNVTKRLYGLTRALDIHWQRPESPFIIGMFHDICKHDQYIKVQEDGKTKYVYNENQTITGHGTKSVAILSKYFTLTAEEYLCIRYHMGAYVKDDWIGLDEAIKSYPTVWWTHSADMMASKVDESA